MMKVLRLTITPELAEQLKVAAKRQSLSMSAYVRLLLLQEFNPAQAYQFTGMREEKL